MPTLLLIVFSAVIGAVAGVLVLGRRGAQQCRRPLEQTGARNPAAHEHQSCGSHTMGTDPRGHQAALHDTRRRLWRWSDDQDPQLKSPDGKVYGIDYSEESVAVARETNRGAIERGQVDIQLGTVSQLPFADGTFDVVTAIETHYYWPDLTRDVRHLMQVLKPGGGLLVVAETYRGRRNDWLIRPIMQGMFRAAYLSPAEHKQLLVDAGYRDVEVFEDRERCWICVRGRR